MNRLHTTIKIEAEWSKSSINFLDVLITLKGGIIKTDLYVVYPDNHQYLYVFSCHPFHCKKTIPYSQALRLNRTLL